LCFDPWRIVGSVDQRPFNYAVRRIQAAIIGDPRFSEIELRLIESSSEDPDELTASIEAFDPDLIGVSAYVWSFPMLLEVCRRAKQARPDRTIVFGGPSSRPEMFELPQHAGGAQSVDAIVIGEGEECFQEIVLAPDKSHAALAAIPGLAVRDGDSWKFTRERRLGPPDQYPSPYALGLMPPDVTHQLESARGCPLSCTYCEWGDTGVVSRNFGYEYLLRELTCLKNMSASGVWLVDPGLNLNSRAFRALAKAEAEVGALRHHGDFRCELYPSHLKDEHLSFLESVRAYYVGIGLQSFNQEVLKGVERPFHEDRFDRVVREVAAIVPDVTVEVIMGLPGDDPESFRRTMEKVLQLPVAVRVFHCLVLPSALMTRAPPSFQLKFDPFTLQVVSCRGWSRDDIEKTREWLDASAKSEDGDIPHAGTWKFRRRDWGGVPQGVLRTRKWNDVYDVPRAARVAREPDSAKSADLPDVSPDLLAFLEKQLGQVGSWSLAGATQIGSDPREGLVARIERPEGPLRLRISRAEKTPRSYRSAHGIAYAYESDGDAPLVNAGLDALDRLIARLHPVMRAVMFGTELGGKRTALPIVESR
jgi:radical SAM superfamily enzyme YgiQ (UPF0313 family)